MTAQGVINAIRTKLAADSALNAYVSGRVYDSLAPQNAPLPLVVLTISSAAIDGRFNTDGMAGELQVDVYSARDSGAAAARAIAQRVVDVLHRGSAGSVSRVVCMLISAPIAEVDEDAIRCICRFRLFCSP